MAASMCSFCETGVLVHHLRTPKTNSRPTPYGAEDRRAGPVEGAVGSAGAGDRVVGGGGRSRGRRLQHSHTPKLAITTETHGAGTLGPIQAEGVAGAERRLTERAALAPWLSKAAAVRLAKPEALASGSDLASNG